MADVRKLIKQRLEEIVGANFAVKTVTGVRNGFQISFHDLEESRSPLITIRPEGLKRHRIEVGFGKFSGKTINKFREADEDSKKLAEAFINQIVKEFDLDPTLIVQITNPSITQSPSVFSIKLDQKSSSPESFWFTCEKAIASIFFAFAELLGYEEVDEEENEQVESMMEGAVSLVTVKRRERSRKNRALALLIHGEQCIACGLNPSDKYVGSNNIIEVHHLQPLSQNSEPRPYNPASDLVPLCPNCHRAIHSFGVIPVTLDELKSKLR